MGSDQVRPRLHALGTLTYRLPFGPFFPPLPPRKVSLRDVGRTARRVAQVFWQIHAAGGLGRKGVQRSLRELLTAKSYSPSGVGEGGRCPLADCHLGPKWKAVEQVTSVASQVPTC